MVVVVIAVEVEVVYQAETKDGKLRDQEGRKGPCPALRVCQAAVQRLTEKTTVEHSVSVALGGWVSLPSDLALMEMI